MKYPYIGKLKENNEGLVLFVSAGFGAQLNSKGCGWCEEEIGIYSTSDDWDEREFTNITREYLANTYGEVKSKEHADFIVKLAEGAGFEVGLYCQDDKWFCFSENFLFFYTKESRASGAKEKLITIPLPPKEPEPKEWPQVGDEVFCEHPSGQTQTGELLALTKEYAIIQREGYEQHLYLKSWELSKPPTPEEELESKIDKYLKVELSSPLIRNLTRAIINGEIKGLSYKPG